MLRTLRIRHHHPAYAVPRTCTRRVPQAVNWTSIHLRCSHFIERRTYATFSKEHQKQLDFANTLRKVVQPKVERHAELKKILSDSTQPKELAQLLKEERKLDEVATLVAQFDQLHNEIMQLQQLIEDPNSEPELIEMAKDDLHQKFSAFDEVIQELIGHLIQRDEVEDCSGAMIEIRPAAGGLEAGLFAAELMNMYKKYAESQSWQYETLSLSTSDLGGIKEAVSLIRGADAFRKLRHESGVHRVQRVPETEALGRVHTSTATVAVLPEIEEDGIFELKPSDLKIETYRAGGAGGQHVNRTESAVRITHIPTGLQVAIQDDRSQHANKARALKILKARVWEMERQKKSAALNSSRAAQIGTGERNERIRTYNFPQDRVTDHRVSLTIHDIEGMMNGEYLDQFIEAMEQQTRRDAVAELLNAVNK